MFIYVKTNTFYADYEMGHLCLKKARRERKIVHCCCMMCNWTVKKFH